MCIMILANERNTKYTHKSKMSKQVTFTEQYNSIKHELNGTKAYEETSTDEKSVVNSHSKNCLISSL